MTVSQAIDRADLTRQNLLSRELKLAWLSELDGRTARELLAGFPGPAAACSGYGGEDEEAELLIPAPYDALYVQYLVMRIDLENGELARYNADAVCFNRLWQSFAGEYVRTHRPGGAAALRF